MTTRKYDYLKFSESIRDRIRGAYTDVYLRAPHR